MYVQTAEALVWLVLVVVALAAAGGILGAMRARSKRKARYLFYYLQASQERQRVSSAPVPLSGGLTPELAEAIRAHAERTATRHWNAGVRDELPVNPYPQATPEHVLWYASYEIKLQDLVDAASGDVVEVGKR